MKKYEVVRKVRRDGITTNETIKGYKYIYKDIEFAIYNFNDNNEYNKSKNYISIIITDNEIINGLAIDNRGYKTINECLFNTEKLIENNYEKIKKMIGSDKE